MPILNMIAQGSGGGGGSNVGEPTNLSAIVTSSSSIEIKWTDNGLQTLPPSTFGKSVLVRKVGSAPTTPSDGTTVVTETVMNTYQSSAYTDTGLTEGTTYYYQVFSYSADGGITYGTPVSAAPSSPWQPGVNTIAYYPLDGDADDYSGNGYNGTPSNVTYTTLASGIEVATFNGSNSKISIPDELVNSLSEFTANVRLCDTASNFGNAFNNQTSATNGVFVDSYNGTQIRTGLGGMPYSVDYSPISLNTWYNIVCVYDNGTFSSYVNGVYFGAGSHTYSSGTNMTIGCRGHDNDRFWTGNISKVIFEDKARTSQEISDYYDLTKGDYGIS